MITIKHAKSTFQVLPVNAEPTRALLALIDKSKGLKGRKFKRASDPKHDSMKRDYPAFTPDMTTGEYLRQYASLNHKRVNLLPVEYTCADRPAPMLDASMPEVIEEVTSCE